MKNSRLLECKSLKSAKLHIKGYCTAKKAIKAIHFSMKIHTKGLKCKSADRRSSNGNAGGGGGLFMAARPMVKTRGDGSASPCKLRASKGPLSVGLAPLPEEEGHCTMTKVKLKEYDSSDSGFTEPHFIMAEPSVALKTKSVPSQPLPQMPQLQNRSLSRCSTPRSPRSRNISGSSNSTMYHLPLIWKLLPFGQLWLFVGYGSS